MSGAGPGTTGKGFVAWWKSAGLAYKFTVVLGGLIVLVIVAAVIKLIIDKLILRKHIKREKIQKASQANVSSERITAKRLSSMEEGELFGVRAIQSGFYGGVAQSAPSSPVTSRAPSLYSQPASPAGPLSGSSPYLPLMHPQASASPLTSTASLPQVRSPLGLNPIGRDGQPIPNGPPSPVPSAMLRNPQRPGTSASSRTFSQSRPPVERHDSTQSTGTINLDGLTPSRHQQNGTSLRPSASDASNTTSTKDGTSAGSRSSSFTSTYSYEDASEHQNHHPKPLGALPTIPVLPPLTTEVNSSGQPQRSSPPTQQQGQSSPPRRTANTTSELPADSRAVQRDMNFSTPFRRPSQPEQMVPSNPEFGPLPAAAMNGGPLQFNAPRTQSPGPMSRGPPPARTDSPILFPPRGASAQVNGRSMSPGPGLQQPPRQGQMQRAGTETPPPPNMEPSLPAFLQGSIKSTEVELPRSQSGGPKTAPLTKTSSSHLMPEMPKKNRLTADILNDFYDSYSYTRNSKDDIALHPQSQHFEMQRIPPPQSLPGSPRQGPRQGPMDRRLV